MAVGHSGLSVPLSIVVKYIHMHTDRYMFRSTPHPPSLITLQLGLGFHYSNLLSYILPAPPCPLQLNKDLVLEYHKMAKQLLDLRQSAFKVWLEEKVSTMSEHAKRQHYDQQSRLMKDSQVELTCAFSMGQVMDASTSPTYVLPSLQGFPGLVVLHAIVCSSPILYTYSSPLQMGDDSHQDYGDEEAFECTQSLGGSPDASGKNATITSPTDMANRLMKGEADGQPTKQHFKDARAAGKKKVRQTNLSQLFNQSICCQPC